MKHTYSGSGILVIDTFNNIPCVILFTKNNNKANDLGGSVDKKDKNDPDYIEKTAIREAREESCNVIQIRSVQILKQLPFIDIPHNTTYYRCYILYLRHPFPSQAYYHNLKILLDNKSPLHLLETNNFVRIRLDELMNCYITNKKYTKCLSVIGEEIYLKNRVRSVIASMFKSKPILLPMSGDLHGDPSIANTLALLIQK